MTYRPYDQFTAVGISDQRLNDSGMTMPKGTAVRFNTAGDMDFINVSIEAHAFSCSGVTSNAISYLYSGTVITTGRVTNFTTTASFGDMMYIDKTGALTNIKPSIGVNSFLAGDFIVSVGVIAKNIDNPTNKDLIVIIDVVGQL